MAMKRFICKYLRKLARSNDGGILVVAAIAAPVLIGTAGLATDVGFWYANARLAQTAADAAAMAGALEVVRSNGGSSQITAAVIADAANNGFSPGNGDTITVNYPPVSGVKAGALDAVEVIVTRPTARFLSSLVYAGNVNVTARAVATTNANNTCVWALNPTAPSAFRVSGASVAEFECGIYVNSNNDSALFQNGAGCLDANEIKVVGGDSTSCASPTPVTGVSPVIDPLAAHPTPTYGVCDYPGNITINGGTTTLLPGTYCGRIKIIANAIVTFESGLYVLNGAALDIGGQATVSGEDVSFYLTENSGMNDAISVSGGATVSLDAPLGGPLPGILFYQDRNAPSNVTHRFTGGANMDLEGILYFPNQAVKFAGGTSFEKEHMVLIADTVDL